MIRKPKLVVLFAALMVNVAIAQHRFSTVGDECGVPAPRKLTHQKTKIWSSGQGALRAYVTIDGQVRHSKEDRLQCEVTYRLWLAKEEQPFKLSKALKSNEEDGFGAEIVGLSSNRRFFAVDFYNYAGDWTGHRPVIVDLNTGEVAVRELREEITKQLPSCDYSQEFVGVTDEGDALIHVPKSTYVDEGCPDQGDWVLDMKSGGVRSLSPHRASAKKQ